MKKEDRELLIKDLCARLPYYVAIETIHKDGSKYFSYLNGQNIKELIDSFNDGNTVVPIIIKTIKPYLFPMSSMTEEQKKEFNNLTHAVFVQKTHNGIVCDSQNEFGNFVYADLDDWLVCIDWLNSHHFDYRGLIDKGLAIDATNLNIY